MSAQHSSSVYPGRTGGPPYCTFCQDDWPCAGSRAEARERRATMSIDAKLDRIIDLLETLAKPVENDSETGDLPE